jgi:heavy metal response regulator
MLTALGPSAMKMTRLMPFMIRSTGNSSPACSKTRATSCTPTYLAWVAHNLERIADRVTNLCEQLVYLVEGKVEELNVSKYRGRQQIPDRLRLRLQVDAPSGTRVSSHDLTNPISYLADSRSIGIGWLSKDRPFFAVRHFRPLRTFCLASRRSHRYCRSRDVVIYDSGLPLRRLCHRSMAVAVNAPFIICAYTRDKHCLESRIVMRVLVVEDERRIADFIRKGLFECGYAVDVAYDGEEALDWPEVAEFDIIILDVMLPVRDGIEVCRELRRRGVQTPILMLTARDAVEDRVRGLDSGADDYLVKPFAFTELLARLRALARRERSVLGTRLQVNDLVLDTATREASRQGRAISLTSKEYALLEYLMRHPNQVLTRTMIAEHVWNYDFDNATNVIDVHIRNLRRKIDDPFPTKLIHTARGAGYRIIDRQPE